VCQQRTPTRTQAHQQQLSISSMAPADNLSQTDDVMVLFLLQLLHLKSKPFHIFSLYVLYFFVATFATNININK